MIFKSPLRYPGGKGALAPSIADIVLFNNLENGCYYEPYAGGGAVGLHLLENCLVEKIFLNDADKRIFFFWKAILNESERFIEAIWNADLSIDEWHRQKAIVDQPENHEEFDIGFATFYLNRCNRSGIIYKAGPIGGYSQNGNWKLDARFKKADLAMRIANIEKMKDRIDFSNLDAIDFLKTKLPVGKKRSKSFVYLDPPYYEQGKYLYMNHYKDSDHKKLASFVKKQKAARWIMTYDNVPEIEKLYASESCYKFSLNYSLQDKKKAKELLIIPSQVGVPRYLKILGNGLIAPV
jgi:DNA adenine methylase